MSDLAYVLAIDPGKATGWASYSLLGSGAFHSGQLDFDETCAMLENWGASLGPALLLVSESFTITVETAKKTPAPWSLELIGVARRTARKYTGRDLILQAPRTAMRFADDERLKKMGWYHRGGEGHDNDAARHLLLLLSTRRLLPPEVLISLVE